MYSPGARDDAELKFYVSEKWAQQRRALEEAVGQQIPVNFEETMLQGQQKWTTWKQDMLKYCIALRKLKLKGFSPEVMCTTVPVESSGATGVWFSEQYDKRLQQLAGRPTLVGNIFQSLVNKFHTKKRPFNKIKWIILTTNSG